MLGTQKNAIDKRNWDRATEHATRMGHKGEWVVSMLGVQTHKPKRKGRERSGWWRNADPGTGVCRDLGSGKKEPPWGLEGSNRARSELGRRQPLGSASALGRFPETCSMETPGRGSEGQSELGPAALVSRTKPARAGPGYSQQEAHVGHSVGWGVRRSLGLGAAAATPAAAKEKEGKRKGEEERRRKGSAGCSTATTCSALLVPMAGRGGGSVKRTPWITHWEGKEKKAGKGPHACSPENSRQGCGAARRASLFSSSSHSSSFSVLLAPRGLLPANSRESGARPPSSSRCGRGSAKLWTSLQPRTTPRECTGATRPVKASPPSWGSWQSAPYCLAGFQQSGRKWASTSEMSGFCSEGWNCHQSSACCKCSAKDDERLWSLFASI